MSIFKEINYDKKEDNEIIIQNDDYEEINEENLNNVNNTAFIKKNPKEDINLLNSNKFNNYLNSSSNYLITDLDPNYNINLKKEAEKSNEKEDNKIIKRPSSISNNIIFNKINNKEIEDMEVDDEGILIDNSKYLLSPKKIVFLLKLRIT